MEDPKPLKGKKAVEVLFQKQLVGPLAYAAAEVLTLEGARDILQKKLSQIFWQVEVMTDNRKETAVSEQDVQAIKQLGAARDRIVTETRKVIVGMDQVIDEI